MSGTTPVIPASYEPQSVVGYSSAPLVQPESEQSVIVQCEPLRSRIVTAKIIGRSRGEPTVILAETER